MTERIVLEDMEKELLVDRYGIDYDGVFDFKSLLRKIEEWCRDNDFHCEMESQKEKVTPEGRDISMGYTVYRRFRNKFFSVIIFDLSVEGMKDVKISLDNRTKMLNQGKVDMIFHSFFMTSQKARWETKAFTYFIRGIIDKFIYKIDRPSFRGEVVGDTHKLINEMKGFLNIYSKIGKEGKVRGRVKGGWA